jgi:hypothetical protein
MEGLKAEQKQRHSPELDCYEGRKSKVGELILDFDTSGRGIRFDGLWKAADERPYVRLDGTSISLVYRASHFDGLFVRGDTRARKRTIAATLKASRHPEIFKTAEHFAGLLAKAEER